MMLGGFCVLCFKSLGDALRRDVKLRAEPGAKATDLLFVPVQGGDDFRPRGLSENNGRR
jgi:hypothetical protein